MIQLISEISRDDNIAKMRMIAHLATTHVSVCDLRVWGASGRETSHDVKNIAVVFFFVGRHIPRADLKICSSRLGGFEIYGKSKHKSHEKIFYETCLTSQVH